MTEGPRLELLGATKRFGETVALHDVDLTLRPGRLHAVIGENGAGKSTAMKLLAGYLKPSSGRVEIDGAPLAPASPREAMRRGVGLVHQHFMLVEPLTAVENLVLGHEPTRRGIVDAARARAEGERLASEAGLALRLDATVAELSVGERQRLEILRVLFRGARALLLDEPTAVLSPVEVDDLYRTLRRLADGGATVAVITHRLDEVVAHADEVTVLRRGEHILHETRPDDEPAATIARYTAAVMGGEIPAPAEAPPRDEEAAVRLALVGVTTGDGEGAHTLRGFSLTVGAGEVVGVAGVEGNGQEALAWTLSGAVAPTAGSVEVDGAPLHRGGDPASRVRHARRAGLVVVHADRHRDEMILTATMADNMVLGDLPIDDEAATVTRRLARFAVRPADPTRRGDALSGGNQQKAVMGRALDRPLAALVVAQPTRGVDVGTARTIQRAIATVAEEGAAVVVISADLNELRDLCHRVVVIRRGERVAELAPDVDEATIGRAMLGVDEEQAS